MKTILKIEELAMFFIAVYIFNSMGLSWWWFIGLILVPDIAMLGYLINSKTGAVTYNIFHHKGIAIVIYFLGIYFNSPMMELAGIMLFAHASMDRIFGYGLKYFDSFNNTHLGTIGAKKK